MMVAVVIIALALATMTWLIRLYSEINQSLHEFYKPGGKLERIHKGIGQAPPQGQAQGDATSRRSTRPDALPADDR
jgi:hypothetical protein